MEPQGRNHSTFHLSFSFSSSLFALFSLFFFLFLFLFPSPFFFLLLRWRIAFRNAASFLFIGSRGGRTQYIWSHLRRQIDGYKPSLSRRNLNGSLARLKHQPLDHRPIQFVSHSVCVWRHQVGCASISGLPMDRRRRWGRALICIFGWNWPWRSGETVISNIRADAQVEWSASLVIAISYEPRRREMAPPAASRRSNMTQAEMADERLVYISKNNSII